MFLRLLAFVFRFNFLPLVHFNLGAPEDILIQPEMWYVFQFHLIIYSRLTVMQCMDRVQ